MKADGIKHFLTILKSVVTEWAPAELNPHVVGAFQMVLGDFADETIGAAFNEGLSTLTSWPAPAKMRAICFEIEQREENREKYRQSLEFDLDETPRESGDTFNDFADDLYFKDRAYYDKIIR